MAISVVSAWKGSAGATSKAITVSPTGGNALYVAFASYQATIANHALTDNIGSGTWVRLPDSGSTSAGTQMSRWVQFGIPAGITTVTCSGGSGCAQITAIIHEVSGIGAYTTGESSVATKTSDPAPTTTAVTNATAASIFFASIEDEDGNNPATVTPNQTGSSPTGWAYFNSNSSETDGSSNIVAGTAFLVVSSSASTAHTWANPTQLDAIVGLVAFHASSGGGGSASITETATATDSPSCKFTTPQSVSESASATSTQSAVKTTPATISESASATDSVSCIVTNPTSVTEPASPANSYSTAFPSVENPISESGKWTNGLATGLDWADVKTTSNGARGTQTGAESNDNDSTAILTGVWGPDQTCSAVVRSINQQTGSIFEEVEFRFRSKITAHSNRGYEVNFRCNADGTQYTQIVRWNGALDDFTLIDSRGSPAFAGIANGDTVSASMIGNLITVKLNGTTVFSATDGTYTDGNPGFGFYLKGGDGTGNLQGDFGFTSFTASSAGTDAQSHESCTVVFAPSITETASAASAQSATATFHPSLAETATAASAQSATAVFSSSVVEAATATDTCSAVVIFAASIIETASAQSSQDAGGSGPSVISESASAADIVSAVVIYAASLTEVASATDSPSAGATYPVSLTETASAQSNQDFNGSAVAGVVESASATDTCSAVVVYSVTVVELSPAQDSFTSTANFMASIAEAANAQSFTSWASGIQLPTNYSGTFKRSLVYSGTIKQSSAYSGTVKRAF